MKNAIRSQRIAIDIPVPDSEPWVNVIVQHLVLDDDGKVIQMVDRQKQMHRRLGEIFTNTVTIKDPLTQEIVTLSGGGLATAITLMVSDWLIEDVEAQGKSAYLNEQGRVIIEQE